MAFVLEPWEKYLRGLVGTWTPNINLKSRRSGGRGRDAAFDLNVFPTVYGKRTHSMFLASRLACRNHKKEVGS